MQIKKTYYAIKNKEGNYFAGYDTEEKRDIFTPTHYYLFDYRVAQSRIKNIDSGAELEIVVSPVQDDSVWNEENPYLTKKK